ncbi:MAG: EAL domain-containing protein [Proteobacteria bacterium]|nr:EAL domain-containing protein [Pseudomonadota bacterium]
MVEEVVTSEEGKPIIICVDDDRANLDALARVLRARCTVLLASNGYEALELVQAQPDVACVLADLRMPGMLGQQLLARVAELRPHCRRAVVTGHPESEDLIAAINAGHLHYVITKPWKIQDIMQVVEQLVVTFKLERDNHRLLGELRIANQSLREHEIHLEAQLESRSREISVAAEQLAQMGHQLDALTLRDPLTGLYTHRAFQERLREEVGRSLRYSQPMAILLADIDGFASVNYDLGYQVGDEILRRLALVLVEDTGRTAEVVARYSGEEFVILLPETAKDGALARATRLRDAVASTEMPGGRKMSLSVGFASLPDDAADPESLLTAVEAALRTAKRGGPGRVHHFSSAEGGPNASGAARSLKHVQPVVDKFRPYQERMHEITAILTRDRALSCLLVDLSRLHHIELDLGVAHHSEIYDHAAAVLDGLRGNMLDPADVICRTGDGDGYFVILAPRPVRIDLDELGQTVERAVEAGLAKKVSEVLREQPRITVGSARVLGNSLIRPERLTARLFSDVADNARNLRERKAHRDRATLQDIILGDGLTSVYQPIVDLGTGDIFAYEALSRGPRGTALESPATLFAIADEVDLTVELDRACFRSALRNAKTLEPVHRLFVNLLPMSFYDAAFIEVEVGNLLSAAGLTPANIVFEITERLAIENFASFKRALGAYTAMGFGVAIDDVGTRHSNLETVMSLRPHFIKISDVLVRGIARSTVKREILRSLRHIADTIDAVMVAEGIEEVEDVVALRDLGLRYGQGYYMARPAPPFITLKDEVRAEMRNITPKHRPASVIVRNNDDEDDDEDEDDRAPALPRVNVMAAGSTNAIPIPRNAFGKAEDEITNDFQIPIERPRPRASEPPIERDGPALEPWQPLTDDEITQSGPKPGSEPLLESIKRPATENDPEGERGPGTPGLN